MSYCEIVTFKDGKPNDSVKYGNAWGGAARIWDALFNTYLKDPTQEYDSWLTRSMGGTEDRSLWDLAKREDLPMCERAVHAATFDRAMIHRENFERFAGHLREFVEKHPSGGRVCHLRKWAEFIESCDAEAVGFYGTSVSENLWFDWDDEADESVPYDMNSRDDHFEVYEWLSGVAVTGIRR